MKKKVPFSYYIILTLFLQVFGVFLRGVMVSAVSEEQKNAILDNCEVIKENLRQVQKNDARARVFLGGKYETILSKFITPFNMALVGNNMSNAKLVENQNEYAGAKALFSDDYVSYQQGLEELVSFDCKGQPEAFYEKLVSVREKRRIVYEDVLKMEKLATEHVDFVKKTMEKL